MQFHNEDGVIPKDALYKHFILARAVIIFLDNHNNCARGDSTTMEATDLENGNSVSAAAHCFLYLQKMALNPTPRYVLNNLTLLPPHAASSQVVKILRLHNAKIGFLCLGFYPH